MKGHIIRALVFTILVPGTVTVWLPMVFYIGGRALPWPVRVMGCIPAFVGAALYFSSTLEFALRGRGTPAIWFTKPLAFLLGREPEILVAGGLYRYMRNPMYVGVILILFGEALLFASPQILWYALGAWLFFHGVVVIIEEPHLRRTQGEEYLRYCASVPRWIPGPRAHRNV